MTNEKPQLFTEPQSFTEPQPFWAVGTDGRVLYWPLALSRVVDALELAVPSLAGPSLVVPSLAAPETALGSSPAARWLRREAGRRYCVRQGLSQGPPPPLDASVSIDGMTLGAWLETRVHEGQPPSEGPVDHATMQPLPGEDWVTIARCGAWKDERIRRVFDERVGLGRWRSGYSWGSLVLDVRSGIELYEDAYTRALERDQELLTWVIGHRDVYDTAPSNLASFMDYSVQEIEGAGQHWQDVAVRRALRRNGVWFTGGDLLEIRGKETGGYRLNPGQLPFHPVHRIAPPGRGGWWQPGSIEDFSIRNFAVQARHADALQWLEREGPSEASLEAVLVAGDAAMLPLLARWFEGASHRVRLLLARAASLVPPSDRAACPSPALLDEANALAAWPAARLSLLDRLLDPEPLARADVLESPALLEDALAHTLLLAASEDPARRLRRRAGELLTRPR